MKNFIKLGHSKTQERKVAKQLYISIIIAVIVAAAMFLVKGHASPPARPAASTQPQ